MKNSYTAYIIYIARTSHTCIYFDIHFCKQVALTQPYLTCFSHGPCSIPWFFIFSSLFSPYAESICAFLRVISLKQMTPVIQIVWESAQSTHGCLSETSPRRSAVTGSNFVDCGLLPHACHQLRRPARKKELSPFGCFLRCCRSGCETHPKVMFLVPAGPVIPCTH